MTRRADFRTMYPSSSEPELVCPNNIDRGTLRTSAKSLKSSIDG